MNYIYGNLQFAIRSYWHVEFDMEKELEKFKGSFVPNLFFKKGFDAASIFASFDKLNKHKVDTFIKKMILAVNITWRNLVNFGGYTELKPINPNRVFDDIDQILFTGVDRLYANQPGRESVRQLHDYCSKWRIYFNLFYKDTIKLLDDHWDGTNHIPDDVIRGYFPDRKNRKGKIIKGGYFYKERSHRKESGNKRTDWSWLWDLDYDSLATEIIRREIDPCDKRLKEALKKRKLSLREAKKAITRISAEPETLNMLEMERWYSCMDCDRKNNIVYFINNAVTGRQSIDDVKSVLINAYNCDPKWIDDGLDCITDVVVRRSKATPDDSNGPKGSII